MKDICASEKCTGCESCRQVCRHNAISMEPDSEGFLHPCVNQALCVDCGLCQKRCPVNTPIHKNETPLKVFSGWSKDEIVRMSSSSGGAFTEIAKLILSKGGAVFGVAMDENVQARHICVRDEKELSKLQGSKYVQSIIGDTFKEAKEELQKGRLVLFTGTPCQIAGLRNFLQKDYDNLYTLDLICHGVPSPRVFKDYIKCIERRIKEPVRHIKFRCKKSKRIFYNTGINPRVEKSHSCENQECKYEGAYYSDPYIRVFLRDNILRSNCYECPYTSIQRVSDFTLADWWGYQEKEEMDKDYDKKGVSLILCNTAKAVDMVKGWDMYVKERTVEEALKTNLSLKKPFPKPTSRELFWNEYDSKTFEEMIPLWMYPELIPLSTYLRIYHRKWGRAYKTIRLYERVMRKLRLNKLIIKVQAK